MEDGLDDVLISSDIKLSFSSSQYTTLRPQAVGDFDLFSLDDVRHTFWDHPWVQLRYSQHLQIKEGNDLYNYCAQLGAYWDSASIVR